jgi:long-subunit fatty acid transport protein
VLCTQMPGKKISNPNYSKTKGTERWEPVCIEQYNADDASRGWFTSIGWTIVLPEESKVSVAYLSSK